MRGNWPIRDALDQRCIQAGPGPVGFVCLAKAVLAGTLRGTADASAKEIAASGPLRKFPL